MSAIPPHSSNLTDQEQRKDSSHVSEKHQLSQEGISLTNSPKAQSEKNESEKGILAKNNAKKHSQQSNGSIKSQKSSNKSVDKQSNNNLSQNGSIKDELKQKMKIEEDMSVNSDDQIANEKINKNEDDADIFDNKLNIKEQPVKLEEKPPSDAPFEKENDQAPNYYQEYCRLYYANLLLTTRLQQLLNEKQELSFKLSRLESNKRKHEEQLGMPFDINEDKRKKKRHRRTATEIARHYRCPCEDCPKSYGSEGSLNQHIKLKHPEFFQQMSVANPNLPGINDSKRGGDSTVNDGHSHRDRDEDDDGSFNDDDRSDVDDEGDSDEDQHNNRLPNHKDESYSSYIIQFSIFQ